MAVERNHYQRIPPAPGPLFGLWSWRYLDLLKMIRLRLNPRIHGFYTKFPTIPPPGSKFPEVDLETVDGGRINTKALQGRRHFVLLTGALT